MRPAPKPRGEQGGCTGAPAEAEAPKSRPKCPFGFYEQKGASVMIRCRRELGHEGECGFGDDQ